MRGNKSSPSGFASLRAEDVPELGATVEYFQHAKSGAHVLSFDQGDAEMCFGIVVRTPLTDSSGEAHILEHVVLHGSRAYPSGAPFVELLRGSLHTHLNASTRRDYTVFLAASRNEADLASIFDVYFDAVFFPCLRDATFRQEGRGVVYNEMLGYLANPAAQASEALRATLFADTPYGFVAGGLPDEIQKLEPAALRAFHTRHYHPSNVLFWFSGGRGRDKQLCDLDRRLSVFGRRAPSLIQTSFARRRAAQSVEQPSFGGAAFTVAGWAFPEPKDQAERIVQHLVADLCIKRLQTRFGGRAELCDGTREPVFSIGIPGDERNRLGDVDGEIARIRDELDQSELEAAIDRIAFSHCNIGSEKRPAGLALLERVAAPWVRGKDPIAALSFADEVARLRLDLNGTKAKVQRQFAELLLDNLHRATVFLSPHQRRARQSVVSIDDQEVDTAEVPETSVPALPLSEISRRIERFEHMVERRGRVEFFTTPASVLGIVGVDIGFSLAAVPEELQVFAGLYGRMILDGSNAIAGQSAVEIRSICDREGGAETFLFLRLRMLEDQRAKILGRLGERLNSPRQPLRDGIQREIYRLEQVLMQRGHDSADWALLAQLSHGAEQVHPLCGFEQLAFLKHARGFSADWLAAGFKAFGEALLRAPHIACNITGAVDAIRGTKNCVEKLVAGLPAAEEKDTATHRKMNRGYARGFVIPSPVHFIGMGWRLPAPVSGAAQAALRHVVTGPLWQKIRVEGGAYSVLGRLDPVSGFMRLISYRDPQIENTLELFRQTASHLQESMSDFDLHRAIVGAIGERDRFSGGPERSFAHMLAQLGGDTDTLRQERHEQLLATTQADFLALADAIAEAEPHVVVLAGEEALQCASIPFSKDPRSPV